MRTAFLLVMASLAMAGCYEDCLDCDNEPGTGSSFVGDTSNDTDLDGIPDSFETSLASDCAIEGRSCQSLGISPPTVGVRDYILVQYGRSGPDQNWRLSDWVWSEFDREMNERGIAYQVTDLGVDDTIDVEATWDDESMDGRYWLTYVGYDEAQKESAGWNEWNHIMMQDLPDVSGAEADREHRMTLLHEVYHSLLGDLEGNTSRCDDEESGGPGHSNDVRSILYVSPDCESQTNLERFDLAPAEDDELAQTPFENLARMNDPSWWQ